LAVKSLILRLLVLVGMVPIMIIIDTKGIDEYQENRK
jgi:hypothetical protein